MKKPTKKELELIRESWFAGFMTSGEGWNGEYPFEGGMEAGTAIQQSRLKESFKNYLKQNYGIPTNKKSTENI